MASEQWRESFSAWLQAKVNTKPQFYPPVIHHNLGEGYEAGYHAAQTHAASLQRQLDAERERRLVLEGVLQNIRMANGHLHGCWLVRGGTRCSPECVVVADALAAPAERRADGIEVEVVDGVVKSITVTNAGRGWPDAERRGGEAM
jgi:hypothetical protein